MVYKENLMVNSFLEESIKWGKVVLSFELKEIKPENEATTKNHNSRSRYSEN
jgi:hypothetical protein